GSSDVCSSDLGVGAYGFPSIGDRCALRRKVLVESGATYIVDEVDLIFEVERQINDGVQAAVQVIELSEPVAIFTVVQGIPAQVIIIGQVFQRFAVILVHGTVRRPPNISLPVSGDAAFIAIGKLAIQSHG